MPLPPPPKKPGDILPLSLLSSQLKPSLVKADIGQDKLTKLSSAKKNKLVLNHRSTSNQSAQTDSLQLENQLSLSAEIQQNNLDMNASNTTSRSKHIVLDSLQLAKQARAKLKSDENKKKQIARNIESKQNALNQKELNQKKLNQKELKYGQSKTKQLVLVNNYDIEPNIKPEQLADTYQNQKYNIANQKLNRKLFVLDTSVLLADPSSLFHFADNDLFLPLFVLEELDHLKNGKTPVAQTANKVIKHLETLLENANNNINQGVSLNTISQGQATGTLFFQTVVFKITTYKINTDKQDTDINKIDIADAYILREDDNQILSIANSLREYFPQHLIVLISNSLHLRVRLASLGLLSEPYRHYCSSNTLSHTHLIFLENYSWQESKKELNSGKIYYLDQKSFIKNERIDSIHINQFLCWQFNDHAYPFIARVQEKKADHLILKKVIDYQNTDSVCGVQAKNDEQCCAFDLLLDTDLDLVTLLGASSSEKVFISLIAALEQIIFDKTYQGLIYTQPHQYTSESCSLLNFESKKDELIDILTSESTAGNFIWIIQNFIARLKQNETFQTSRSAEAIEHIKSIKSIKSIKQKKKPASDLDAKKKAKLESSLDNLMHIFKATAFEQLPYQNLDNQILIVDDAQNLSVDQTRYILEQAGENTKIVLLGNVSNIDDLGINQYASGLSLVINQFKNWPHSAHLFLKHAMRSRLSQYLAKLL